MKTSLSPEAQKLCNLTPAQQRANLVRVAKKVLSEPETLNMRSYHAVCDDFSIYLIFHPLGPPDFKLMQSSAGRIHCLAGHAISDAGVAGFELAYQLGGARAGELLLGLGIENFDPTREWWEVLRQMQSVVDGNESLEN